MYFKIISEPVAAHIIRVSAFGHRQSQRLETFSVALLICCRSVVLLHLHGNQVVVVQVTTAVKEDVASHVHVLVSDRVEYLLPSFAAPVVFHVHEVGL